MTNFVSVSHQTMKWCILFFVIAFLSLQLDSKSIFLRHNQKWDSSRDLLNFGQNNLNRELVKREVGITVNEGKVSSEESSEEVGLVKPMEFVLPRVNV